MVFTIDRFPMPLSVNQMYANIKGRFVKSKQYRAYEKDVYKWLTNNGEQLVGVRNFIKDFADKYVLDVSTSFYFTRKNIVCMSGKPKRNDTSNRIKALHDVWGSIILGIDDSYFWSGTYDKFVLKDGESEEYVRVTFRLRTINENEAAGA